MNLIPRSKAPLSDWNGWLVGSFDSVGIEHSHSLARREGQPTGALNKISVEHGSEHLFILDRPTTIGEYDEDEINTIKQFVPLPEQFIAVDFTDKALLLRVLRSVLGHAGFRSVLVEDEDGAFVWMEDFVAKG